MFRDLVDCPNLRDIRRELRSDTVDAFNNVSSLLGGSTEGKSGKPYKSRSSYLEAQRLGVTREEKNRSQKGYSITWMHSLASKKRCLLRESMIGPIY